MTALGCSVWGVNCPTWLVDSSNEFWLGTIREFDNANAYLIYYSHSIYYDLVDNSSGYGLRPVVTLKKSYIE